MYHGLCMRRGARQLGCLALRGGAWSGGDVVSGCSPAASASQACSSVTSVRGGGSREGPGGLRWALTVTLHGFCFRDKRPSPEAAAEPREGDPSPSLAGCPEPPSSPFAPYGQRDQPEPCRHPARCPGPRGAGPGHHALLPLRVPPPAPPAGIQPTARESPAPPLATSAGSSCGYSRSEDDGL